MVVQEYIDDVLQNVKTTEEAILAIYKEIKNIIVVGNTTPKLCVGDIIDSHDCVIRLNNYHLYEYEKLTGSKVNIWGTFGGIPWVIKNAKFDICLSPFKVNSVESTKPIDGLKVIYPDVCINEFLNIERPTTGTSFLALFDYLNIPVDAICYDFFTGPNIGWNYTFAAGVHTELDKEERFVKTSKYIRLL